MDLLRKLDANIDIKNKMLKTKSGDIPIFWKSTQPKTCYFTVGPRVSQVVKVPVNSKNCEGIIEYTQLCEGIEIPASLVRIDKSYAYVTVTNFNTYPCQIQLNKPLDVTELNQFEQIKIDDNQNLTIDQENLLKANLKQLRLDHLNQEEKAAIRSLCYEYRDIFHCEKIPLSFTSEIKHCIKTTDNIPVYIKPYRLPFESQKEVQKQVEDLLEQGIIRPSTSPWSSPILIVPKKSDASGKKKYRMVVDYRRLNDKTIDDRYPLPNITEILDKLGKCQYFTTLDLASGFHQIQMNEEDKCKTAFSTPRGLYEYNRLPFGLKGAPPTFQRVMDNILRGVQNEKCIVYMDDIIIYSVSLQEHVERLRAVFDCLRTANFKIQMDKSEFLRKEVAFLGHVVTPEGVLPNPAKIEAVIKYPIPKTTREIKAFLGLIGYYRRFIKDFAKITKPLTKCLKKEAKIIHDTEFIKSFETCKKLLVNHPILQYPDLTKPFIVTTDASNFAIGAVLSQGEVGKDRPVCYASRTLNASEQKLSTIEKELLAIVWATKYFRPYLYGRKFIIYTDHRPLSWLFNLKDPNSKLQRWRIKMDDLDYKIIHKPGKLNLNADALSRIQINAIENESVMPNIDEDEIDAAARNLEVEDFDLPDLEPEEIEELLRENSNSETVHTQVNPEPIQGIKILDDIINNKPLQYFLSEVFHNPKKCRIEKINGRTILQAQFTKSNNEQEIIKFLREYTAAKKKYYLFFETDKLYKDFCRIYTKIFNDRGPELIKCTQNRIVLTTKDEIFQIIQSNHESKTNHRGIAETVKRIQRKYYFKNMQTEVSDFLSKCEICKRAKYDRIPPKTPINVTSTPSKPFQNIHVDTFTIERQNYLTLVDAFSKLGQAIPIQGKNSVEITEALITFFSFYGIPDNITADNGVEFNSKLLQDLLDLHKINVHFVTENHPDSNAIVERFHSTILEHIRIMRLKHQKDPIVSLMKYAVIAYNNTIHSSTNFTPNELTMGNFSEKNPYDIDYEKQLYQDYITDHRDKLKLTYNKVKEKMDIDKQRIAERRNEGTDTRKLQVGSKVYEKNYRSKRTKTAERNLGPFTITKISDKNVAVIENNKVKKYVHLKNLRHAVFPDTQQPPLPPSSPLPGTSMEQPP